MGKNSDLRGGKVLSFTEKRDMTKADDMVIQGTWCHRRCTTVPVPGTGPLGQPAIAMTEVKQACRRDCQLFLPAPTPEDPKAGVCRDAAAADAIILIAQRLGQVMSQQPVAQPDAPAQEQ